MVLSGVSTNIALPGACTEAVALGYSVVLAEDCTAGATAETHQMQITQHLPLLATVTDAESVIASLKGGPAGAIQTRRTQRAARCEEYGGPGNVVIRDIPDPVVTPGHVVVDVAAAAVNYPRPAPHRQPLPGVGPAPVYPRQRVRGPGGGRGRGSDGAVAG